MSEAELRPSRVADVSTVEDGGGWGALDQLPGNPMMWVLILSEILVFGAFFVGFGVARAVDPVTFDTSQASLDRLLGGINTLVLVTSGLLVAQAVRVRAECSVRKARVLMGGAMVLGCMFLAVKVWEYAGKAEQGIGIETNTFFTLFYLMSGFHALHVVLGLIILAVVSWKCSLENMETVAAFWHMVDLIWIILYPIVYLIR